MTHDEIIAALANIKDPDLHRDIVSLGFVKKVEITDRKIDVEIQLTTPACPVRDDMKSQAVNEIRRLGFTGDVNVTMASQVVSHANQVREQVLPGVKNTIAVASGKGGVGKSTIAVNLAAALAKDGAKVGIVDADVYGPSLPLMLGVTEKPQTERIDENRFKIYPIEKFGIKMMSIGFLVDTETPMIWRGPMASGAVKQFLTDVVWEDLDYMIFDLPPGTGDVQLTLVQTIPLTGAVIVTTPQDVSLADVRRGIRMFQKVNVPIFGVVENMSYYICSHCGHREEIFSNGGGRKTAEKFSVPFLGEIPIYTPIRIGGDTGKPIVLMEPESEQAQLIQSVARRLAAQVSITNMSATDKPKIEIAL
ncbi:MAG: iron-sulfur cluster carrier protein ApbC [Bacteroidetes bacterium]|nr:iron-sulfur cluster carrier protein ApbC [Bacteroidota bacterium]MCL5738940.1 iron-sulfur cluster carrier protein ApbC [Bacteroidota bacterium]